MWKVLIKLRPSLILTASRDKVDERLFRVALRSGYIINERDLQNCKSFCRSSFVMREAIMKNPSFIRYCSEMTCYLISDAIKLGYKPTIEDLENNNHLGIPEIVNYLISNGHPEALKYIYQRVDFIDAEKALKTYKPTMEDLRNNPHLGSIASAMKLIIKEDVNAIIYIDIDNEKTVNKIVKYALDNGYHPNIETIKYNKYLCSVTSIFKILLKKDYNNILYYKGHDEKIFRLAIKLGYVPNIEEYKKYYGPNYIGSDAIMLILVKENPELIELYTGNNVDVFKTAINSGYKVKKNSEETCISYVNNKIIEIMTSHDFSTLKSVPQKDIYAKIFKIAFKLGYTVNANELNSYLSKMMGLKEFKRIIDNSSINDCFNLIYNFDLSDLVIEYILISKHIIIPVEYVKLSKSYNGDKYLFISSYFKICKFLNKLDIDKDSFFQYSLSRRYDWLFDMLYIFDNDMIGDFIKVKNFFFDNYYLKDNSNLNNARIIQSFINIIKNYVRYPELCLSIVNNNISITDDILEKIDYLFEVNLELDDYIKPKTIDDLEIVNETFLNNYLKQFFEIEQKEIEEIKDIICHNLFNEDLKKVIFLLEVYGDTEDLRQLLFDNRGNFELNDIINEMMIYTSMMEAIIESTDKDYLIEMAKRIALNFEVSSRCMMLFTKFEEKMQKLYSEELSSNLTNLKDDISLESLIDKEMSEECGVDVLDFSDKQYCLVAHIKSSRETINQVIRGKSSGVNNFISLSAISHRNQIYYSYDNTDIIFGYDSIPKGAFIQSSVINIGTNFLVGQNSVDVKETYRRQRGILKTSTGSEGYNSEILCFREGVKPKYIILPGGREPTKYEIDVAQKYNLKFVKTQNIKQTIENPKKIENELLNSNTGKERIDLSKLEELKDILISLKPKTRKIALFTDSHALFEPTLAILEDARKSGITEIYSLGDNIGTGPNPREVMELLDAYGVESLRGNHEIYATLGIDELKQHLVTSGGYEETKRNSSWTRAQLTKAQISKIKSNPESRIIEIGGQKILLTHYTRDYNTGYKLQVPEEVSRVFQGHRHFEDNSDEVTTLRGVGIGGKQKEKNKAYYIVLVERPDGGFDIERHIVEYDYNSLMHDIEESDMDMRDKNKIGIWAGVSRCL